MFPEGILVNNAHIYTHTHTHYLQNTPLFSSRRNSNIPDFPVYLHFCYALFPSLFHRFMLISKPETNGEKCQFFENHIQDTHFVSMIFLFNQHERKKNGIFVSLEKMTFIKYLFKNLISKFRM